MSSSSLVAGNAPYLIDRIVVYALVTRDNLPTLD